MNRINQMIDMYATMAADCFLRALLLGHDGFFEECSGYAHDMIVARYHLTMWIKISRAIRGWQL